MKVAFLARFSKDLDAITDPSVKADIKATIGQVKSAPNQKAITEVIFLGLSRLGRNTMDARQIIVELI